MTTCTVVPNLESITLLQRLNFQVSLYREGLKRVSGYMVWTTEYPDELNQAPIAKRVDQALRLAAHHARLPAISYLVQIGDSPLIRVGWPAQREL